MNEASSNRQLPSVQWVEQEQRYFITFTGSTDGFYREDRAETELEVIDKIISIFQSNDMIHVKWNLVLPQSACHFLVSDMQVNDDIL